MTFYFVPALVISLSTVLISGCATIPGKNRQEQIETIDQLISRTKIDLEKQDPRVKDKILNSVGIVFLNNKITKIPMFGAGTGYGVGIDNKTNEKTYLRMTRFDFGAGWGARSVRAVLIFHDENKFDGFINGIFDVKIMAEASAKVGHKGVAGGTGAMDIEIKKQGFTPYIITDAGVSATWSLGFIRVKPIKLKR